MCQVDSFLPQSKGGKTYQVIQGVQSSRKSASSVERKSVDNKHTLFNSELHFCVTVDRLATAVNKD
jgi:hypothetical protein